MRYIPPLSTALLQFALSKTTCTFEIKLQASYFSLTGPILYFYFIFLLFYAEWQRAVKTDTDSADVGAWIHVFTAEDTRNETAT